MFIIMHTSGRYIIKKFTKPQESENVQNLYNQNKMQNVICLKDL